MKYGSGAPLWGKSEGFSSEQQGRGSGELKNRYEGQSYQNSAAGSYKPPNVSGSKPEQQTQMMEDTLRTNYEAEGTAATVLSQMTTQRYQLQSAHDNVYDMRETTEKAKRELADLAAKTKRKKRRLQTIVALLAVTDMLLFLRILQCGGSFFCRHY
mmetsp:Transcript_10256/g.21587  ORF Transcript_10256/g.21587 Transcript_10256/m.21587 type:complete len:156 (-) Transcript_10256:349-816(-)|eukprot:CAMPEP_0183309510 /NCGR_PEP_ID=MMETSP0160_2-20130417/25387_1 /TAXON_ID=2839 ORGANISM="Odontella Sinensis, Strain Grunow 1884" /NCGR_SAMPLE_ID=MMETSP0160_2 /ASSEMBLY_ACC=CAM_ASM_000250 /LENGTH=155 /DNA_ID=CAMNT_0025473551 /DNA_START=235 /DNA_END=702 /DNA_ORIENTATION=-